MHRFVNEWEKVASLDLRVGRAAVLGTYFRHERVREGTSAEMIDAAYLAWRADLRAGRSSVLVTESTQQMVALNERARAERILDGDTLPSREVRLGDGTRASVGDLVITRRNDRHIHTMRGGWVRNGDRWRIHDVFDDGSVVAQRPGMKFGGTVVLPAGYVAEHVDLGYAITAHRAQGLTVDTAHVVVTTSTTRENLYVSMTRGRESNIAYVALDVPDDSHAAPSPDEVTAHTVLFGVLQRSGIELSAHQSIEAEQEHWSSFAQLAAEYLTIAAEAQRDRWTAELSAAGLTRDQVDALAASDAFGPLAAELRRAEGDGHDIAQLLPRVVAQRTLDDAEDLGAVLISRLRHTASPVRRGGSSGSSRIAGLIPVAGGAMDDEMRRALAERQELMESRAIALAETAVAHREPWLRRLGEAPIDPQLRHEWMGQVQVVAAYRDRYAIESRSAVGSDAVTAAQRLDAARARQAAHRAASMVDRAIINAQHQPARGGPGLR